MNVPSEKPRAPLPERATVSVIVPCRNEVRYLAQCLDSILGGDFPHDRLEVLVVDGRSDDGTREIAARYAAENPTVQFLDNPGRIAPTALNIGVRAARGDIVMRMDAHVRYPRDYIATLVQALTETGADNVGGVIETVPANDGAVAHAIAVALAHPFGVGNAYFRTGASSRRWVDAVSFGCYRRDVFERIGFFDEELVRNQDDEFDLRLIKHGGRILLLPEVVAQYVARGTLRQLARMYFQYGYFKPLVARKLGRVMTVRQLVPPMFVLSLLGGILLGPFVPAIAAALALVVGLYLAGVIACAASVLPRRGARCALALLATFPVLHVSYGLGFLRGIVEHLLVVSPRPTERAAVPLSR